MNKIFQVIWSNVKQCYVVVSEKSSRIYNAYSVKKTVKNSLLALSVVSIFTALGGVNSADAENYDYFNANSSAGTNKSISSGAKGADAIAIGKDANAAGKESIALGVGATTEEKSINTIVIGKNAKGLNAAGSIIIGNEAFTRTNFYNITTNVIIGTNASSSGGHAVAIGGGAEVTGSGGLAIGGFNNPDKITKYRTLPFNDLNSEQQDAYRKRYSTMRYLRYDDPKNPTSTAVSWVSASNRINTNTVVGRDSVAFGNNLDLRETRLTVGLGSSYKVSGEKNIVLGNGPDWDVAALIQGNNNISIGAENYIIAGGDINFTGKDENQTTWIVEKAPERNTVLGAKNIIFPKSTDNTILGSNNSLAVRDSKGNEGVNNVVILGSNIKNANAANSIYLGSLSVANLVPGNYNASGNFNSDGKAPAGYTTTGGENRYGGTFIDGVWTQFAGPGEDGNGVITVGAPSKERRIQNLAAGVISPTSTDAINGSQLYLYMKGFAGRWELTTTDGKTPLSGLVRGKDGKYYPEDAIYNANGDIVGTVAKPTTKPAALYEVDGNKIYKLGPSGNRVDNGTEIVNAQINPFPKDKTYTTPMRAGNILSSVGEDSPVSTDAGGNAYLTKLRQLSNTPTDNVLNYATTVGDLQNVANSPIHFQGDNTTVISKKLDEKLKILGGAKASDLVDNNIGTVGNTDGSITVKLSKNLNGLSTVTATDSIIVGPKTVDGAKTTITPDSITTNKVTGLTDPTDNSDAVNKKYVDDSVNGSKFDFYGSSNKTNYVAPKDKHIGILGDATDDKKATTTGNIITTGNPTDGTITVKLADKLEGLTEMVIGDTNITSGNVTVGKATDTKVELGSNKVAVGGKTYITKDGLNGNNQAVTNVNSVLKDKDETNGDGTNQSDFIKALNAQADSALNNAATVGDLKKLANSPLFFEGDTANTTIKRNLGQKLSIVGGANLTKLTDRNIGVETDETTNKLTVKLAKDLVNLDSVTVGDTTKSTAITKDGIVTAKVSGLDAPEGEKDATNKKYVDDAVNGSKFDFYGSSNKTDYVAPKDKHIGILGDAADDKQATTTGNIITTGNAADGTITVKLADKLEGLKEISVGDTNITSGNVTIGKDAATKVELASNKVAVGGKTYITNAGLDANNQKVTNVADGNVTKDSKDSVNGGQLFAAKEEFDTKLKEAAWTINVNGKAVADSDSKVHSGDTTNFANGKGITATINSTDNGKTFNVVYDVNTTDLTVDDQGKVTATTPDTDSTNTFTTGKTVADAINNAVKNSVTTFTADSGDNVAPVERNVKVLGGAKGNLTNDNIGTVGNKDGSITVKLAENIIGLKSVTVGDATNSTVIGEGTVGVGDKTYISKDGLNANDKTITNVKSELTGNGADGTFADNLKKIDGVDKGLNNAATVGDLQKLVLSPIKVSGDTANKTISHNLGDEIKLRGGASENALSDNNIGVIVNDADKSVNIKLAR